MGVNVYLLHGGVGPSLGGLLPYGWDAPITSRGMDLLAERIRALRGVNFVHEWPWGQMDKCWREIVIAAPQHENEIVLIGYSGGGTRAAMIANQPPRPRIDLLILYDPSPAWQMVPVPNTVAHAVCYENTRPVYDPVKRATVYESAQPLYDPIRWMKLGGGHMVSQAKVSERVPIAEMHLSVQNDERLHQRTIRAIQALTK